ncbi:hypothetical protein BDZ88DRAFT_412760 [Geranomyces variabilis]|nr:hypothetical protein BDZ88DRAFT_412760 [Geranomyces variabilis]KAJ3136926.1 hypothetical protein HDU90_002492 [Geranomyces variabilis]
MPKAKSLEESVGTAVSALFSDDALSYDRVLVQQITDSQGGWISFRFVTGRKVGTTDEAVIAHAIRAHAPELELSAEGRSVRRKAPIPDFSEMDSRTVYVERIPIKKPGPVLLTQLGTCGPIEKVIIPPEAVNPLSDYAFVVFESVAGCMSALEKYASSFRLVTADTNLREYLEDKERETETETNGVVELLGKVRVLSKRRWIELSDEYEAALAARHDLLRRVTHQAVGTHAAEYQAKVVGRFWDVHSGTNTKVLKRLFEMVAPVAFVEFRRNNGTGYVRFKTPNGAHLASTYFNSEYIVQQNANDCGTLLMQEPKSKRKAKQAADNAPKIVDPGDEWAQLAGEEGPCQRNVHVADEAEPPPKYPNVKLKLLTGQDEATYWEMIANKRQEKTAYPSHDPPARPSADAPNPVHVKFEASDDEEEFKQDVKAESGRAKRSRYQETQGRTPTQFSTEKNYSPPGLKSKKSEKDVEYDEDATSKKSTKKNGRAKRVMEEDTTGTRSTSVELGKSKLHLEGDADVPAVKREKKKGKEKRGRGDAGGEDGPTQSSKRAK